MATGEPFAGLAAFGRGHGPGRRPLGRLGVTLGDGDHVAIAYWSPGELLDVIADSVHDGIEEGDLVVHLADDAEPTVVEAALRARGVAVEAEQSAGRLVITTAAELLLEGGRFDAAGARARIMEFAEAARGLGLARVRLSVEMTYLLGGAPGLEAVHEFETRLAEDVRRGLPLVRLYAFNLASREVTDLVADALRAHAILISHGQPLANPYFRPWSELRAGPQPWQTRTG